MKNWVLVDQIQKVKGKVVVGSHVKDLCHQIEKLTERLNYVVATNEKITSELWIVKNVNSNLKKRRKVDRQRQNNTAGGIMWKYQESRMAFWTMTLKKKLSRYVKTPISSLRPVIQKVVIICRWEEIVPAKTNE